MPNCRHCLNPFRLAERLLRPAMVVSLCMFLVLPQELSAEAPGRFIKKAPKPHNTGQMTPDQKVLHALNRFSFGPRPGELDTVRSIGLEAWFQEQLHPERVPDDAFALRLAQYPAMQLPQEQLMERYPPPGLLKRYVKGGLAAPQGDVEQAIYADAGLRYREKVEAKQAARNAASGTVVPAETIGQVPSGTSVAGPLSTAAPVVRTGPANGTGASTAEIAFINTVLNLPAEVRMHRLLAMSPEQMSELQEGLKAPEQVRLLSGMTPEQKEQVEAMRSPERLVGAEVLSTRLLRDIYSQRQLQAVMADFWLNHFNVYLRKNQNEPYLLPAYERETVLPNALGNFEDLLIATARSPAMLIYLDNWESVGPNSKAAGRAERIQASRPDMPAKAGAKLSRGINENYARELMELHTLGVKGGYTQQDVIEVAKCFTGWTIQKPDNGGGFVFDPNRHEPGQKIVLGHVIPAGGIEEGLEVLHLLATSPATARFLSEKLAERFVSDTPPAGLVARMSATFLKTGGNISAVLTTMFHSPEFWSPDVFRAKVKTPLEFAVSALRATNAEITNPVPLVQALDRLGMPLYGMQTPNGYSWQADTWVSSNALLTRMNFALVLSGNRLGGTHLSWPAVLGGVYDATSPDPETERRLEQVLLGQPAAPQTREAALDEAKAPGLQQQAEQSFRALPIQSRQASMQGEGSGSMLRIRAGRNAGANAPPETPLATIAGLLLGSPDFQRR